MLHANGAKPIRDIINAIDTAQEHKESKSYLVIIITF